MRSVDGGLKVGDGGGAAREANVELLVNVFGGAAGLDDGAQHRVARGL